MTLIYFLNITLYYDVYLQQFSLNYHLFMHIEYSFIERTQNLTFYVSLLSIIFFQAVLH